MRKLILFSIIIALVSGNNTSSQIKFSIGPTIGYTGPMGDFGGTTIDYYNGTKYGLNGGVNFGAQAKLKLLILNIKGSAAYTSLSNSGNSEPGQGSVETNMKLLTFGLGTEFHLPIPLVPVNPYIGLELLFTNFNGETVFNGVARVPSGTYSMTSTSRTGLGVGAGVEISFGKKSSLDIGVKYNMYNLIGRSFSGGDNRIDTYTSLNDAADPLYSTDHDKHPVSSSRLISAFQFNLSYLFDF